MCDGLSPRWDPVVNVLIMGTQNHMCPNGDFFQGEWKLAALFPGVNRSIDMIGLQPFRLAYNVSDRLMTCCNLV